MRSYKSIVFFILYFFVKIAEADCGERIISTDSALERIYTPAQTEVLKKQNICHIEVSFVLNDQGKIKEIFSSAQVSECMVFEDMGIQRIKYFIFDSGEEGDSCKIRVTFALEGST